VPPETGSGVRKAALSVAVLGVIFLLSVQGIRPPAPKIANAPATQFSSARAFETLNRLVGNDVPHPVGSPASAAVRDGILAELKARGYDPEVQTAFACGQYGTCATVNNIVARLAGTTQARGQSATESDDPSVLLCAHYDSVPAGPGVSDDAIGVAAVLEVARALKSLSAPKRSVIILIDDGEEAGLLGARAFVGSHRWAHNVRAAVNLDARGTSGPSLMFETGSANQWAVRLFASRAVHPATNSIDYTVYKLLPNDTDFTVFKAAGYQGLNFAFIGDVPHYHTPLDNIANASPASLQHQGENALSSVLALANADLSDIPPKEDVYFDFFQTRIIRFAAKWALPLALLVFFAVALQIAWLFRTSRLSSREFVWAALLWLAIVAATPVLALLLRGLMRLASAISVDWVAHPFPLELAFWSLATAVVFTLGILFGRRAGFWGFWAGVWAWWALLAVFVAWLAPGVSYIFLLPAGVAALFAIPMIFVRNPRLDLEFSAAAAIFPVASAGIVAFAPLLLLYDGLGNRALPFIAAFVAIVLTPLLPLCADIAIARGVHGALFSWIPIASFLAAAFLAVIVPQFSAKAPERVNIQYWKDADTGAAQWIVQPASGRLPEPIGVAAMFKRADKGPFPWDRGFAYLTPAPRLTASEPSLTILESSLDGTHRNYRALLRSERGAPEALLLFPPNSGVENVSMQGQALGRPSDKRRFFFMDWNVYRCLALSSEGVQMTFTLPAGKPLQVYVVDVSYGLPVEGKFLLDSRPLTAVPSQDGDLTIFSRGVQLLP
jgi:peptidase M28-like protein